MNYNRITKTHIEKFESKPTRKAVTGFVCKDDLSDKGLLDTYDPPFTTTSTKWKNWITMLDPKTCIA